jgi:predicted peroxiredoxin
MKLKQMATLIGTAALGLALTIHAAERKSQSKDGVFIHLSEGQNDPQRVLMALHMANLMSEDHAVLVYFDIKAIEVVLKDAKDLTYSHFPSSLSQLAKLRERGVLLMACPGCLKAAGKSAADLAPGIQIADKTKFFSFTTGRILTLDY